MGELSDATYLREQAEKCRWLAASVTDDVGRNALMNLAARYEREAAVAEAIKTTAIISPKPELEP